MKLATILLNLAKNIKSSFTRLTALETRMDETIEVHQTQVGLPSTITASSGSRHVLLNGVDIRTLPYGALDDIRGMTKTLVGVSYLWSNGANGIPIDILVSDNKVTVHCYFYQASTVSAIRLLTFWK